MPGNYLTEIPVNGEIGIRANNLPNFHPDPADRIIVATALEGHRLLTADELILRVERQPGPAGCQGITAGTNVKAPAGNWRGPLFPRFSGAAGIRAVSPVNCWNAGTAD